MTRIWNSDWIDPIEDGDPSDRDRERYVDCIRRMILASVNWIENNPGIMPTWEEMRIDLEEMGIPDNAQVVIVAPWDEIIRPLSNATSEWFKVIVAACVKGRGKRWEPSYRMILPALASGMLVKLNGWDAFNRVMLSGDMSSLKTH